VKKIYIVLCLVLITSIAFAQEETGKKERKQAKKEEKRKRTAALIKQEEEGVLAYNKQTAFGLQLRTNGYAAFLELGRMKTPRFTNLYALEVSEIFHPKEEKVSSANQNYFGGSFKYGKIKNFYQVKLGFGQQYVFGQKGNKNGIAVLGVYQGGFSLGLLKPYYIDVSNGSDARSIRYHGDDTTAFLGGDNILGSSGLGKGWDKAQVRPGAFAKLSLRFDFDSFNETIKALEIGLSVDAYAKEVQIMAFSKPERLFFQGHIGFVFGGRK
jgi:hypothetical protein